MPNACRTWGFVHNISVVRSMRVLASRVTSSHTFRSPASPVQLCAPELPRPCPTACILRHGVAHGVTRRHINDAAPNKNDTSRTSEYPSPFPAVPATVLRALVLEELLPEVASFRYNQWVELGEKGDGPHEVAADEGRPPKPVESARALASGIWGRQLSRADSWLEAAAAAACGRRANRED